MEDVFKQLNWLGKPYNKHKWRIFYYFCLFYYFYLFYWYCILLFCSNSSFGILKLFELLSWIFFLYANLPMLIFIFFLLAIVFRSVVENERIYWCSTFSSSSSLGLIIYSLWILAVSNMFPLICSLFSTVTKYKRIC